MTSAEFDVEWDDPVSVHAEAEEVVAPLGTLMAPCKGASSIQKAPTVSWLACAAQVQRCRRLPPSLGSFGHDGVPLGFYGVLWCLLSFPEHPWGSKGFPAVSCGSPEGPLGASWMCASVLHVNGTTGGLPCAGAATSAISSLTLL